MCVRYYSRLGQTFLDRGNRCGNEIPLILAEAPVTIRIIKGCRENPSRVSALLRTAYATFFGGFVLYSQRGHLGLRLGNEGSF